MNKYDEANSYIFSTFRCKYRGQRLAATVMGLADANTYAPINTSMSPVK
jgi:hypothetical protein